MHPTAAVYAGSQRLNYLRRIQSCSRYDGDFTPTIKTIGFFLKLNNVNYFATVELSDYTTKGRVIGTSFVEDVFRWCIENLEKPAYYITFKRRDHKHAYKKVLCSYRVWSSMTNKLYQAIPRSINVRNGRVVIVMTMQFQTEADQMLFVMRWGSVPIERNANIMLVTNDIEKEFIWPM